MVSISALRFVLMTLLASLLLLGAPLPSASGDGIDPPIDGRRREAQVLPHQGRPSAAACTRAAALRLG